MCGGCSRRNNENRDENHGLEPRVPETVPWNLEEMLRELEEEAFSWYRRAMIRALKNDPFYQLMDLSTSCRMWMMRYVKVMAFVVEELFQMNLLEYFESKHTEEVLQFLEIYYAPDEMIAQWERLHPVMEKTESGLPTSTTEADQPS